MQVAHQTDHVTHAVLGGSDNISFGISDDPAFFQILSQSLYKDPLLAMIRETICNGWDAHIDSGRTDRSLTITLTGEKLVIRDYGRGIPHDKIGPVYAVYGASTKKNDGRQTGGFGLGCKSPFAYTDHFEVISHHAGTRTIYSMSKSSAEKMGKPSVTKIASFPTEESGIQISIDLKGDAGDNRINLLIRQVVFNGDILATLNSEQLPVLGLSKAENGFMLINDQADSELSVHHLTRDRIYVRYGNVIYPVESSEEIQMLYNKTHNLLTQVYKCRLILMSPPNSISITPSRESLTMSELTVNTLKILLSDFLAKIMRNRELTVRHEEMVVGYVDAAAISTEIHVVDKLRIEDWHVPGIPSMHKKKFLSSVEDFAMLEVLLRYSGNGRSLQTSKWLSVINRMLNGMAAAGAIPRGLTSTWQDTARKAKKFLQNPKHAYRSYYSDFDRESVFSEGTAATGWWRKRVMVPLVRKLQAAVPDLKADKITFMSRKISDLESERGSIQTKRLGAVYMPSHTNNLIHLIQPTVVVCHNAQIITRRMKHVMMSESTGTFQFGTYFVIELTRVKDKAAATLEMLSSVPGIELMDLTGRLDIEEVEYQDRISKAQRSRRKNAAALADGKDEPIKKVKRAGLVRMDVLLVGSSKTIDTEVLVTEVDPTRTTEPTFIEKVSTAVDTRKETSCLNEQLAFAVAKLWGSQGAVTNNQAVYDRQIAKGTMNVSKFLIDRIAIEIAVKPEILEFMKYDEFVVDDYIRSHCACYTKGNLLQSVYRILLNNDTLSTLVPGFTPLSYEDQLRVVVWRNAKDNYRFHSYTEIQEARKALAAVPLCDEVKEFADKLIANPLIGLLDNSLLEAYAVKHSGDPAAMTKVKDILNLIIN
jgi:hypothetical protein